MNATVNLSNDEFSDMIKESSYKAVKSYFEEQNLKNQQRNVLSIRKVCKITGKSFNTIKKLCTDGIIKTTTDGKITEAALNNYLNLE